MAGEGADSVGRLRAAPQILPGIAGSPGLAIGPALVLDTRRPGVVHRRVAKHQASEELVRFDQAVELAARTLLEVAERLRAGSTKAETSILEAYVMMVRDETLREDVERRICIDRQCVEWAVDEAVREMSEHLRGAKDPYLAERSHDIEFVGDRLLLALAGRHCGVPIPELHEPVIIVAHDLSPAETAGLSREHIRAIVTEVGTRTSHTAILARSLEIPAIVGVPGLLSRVGSGDQLIVDGLRGMVTLAPTHEMLDSASRRAARHVEVSRELRERRDEPAVTRCGERIHIRANIELPAEASIVAIEGADGIGLYRTEFLFVDRVEAPSEEEQFEVYRAVAQAVAPLPVTLRSFDLGGDKFANLFGAREEHNPSLGVRAVRLGLTQPHTFIPQLRAMVRASAYGNVRILVPMVAALWELRAVRKLLEATMRELDEEGIPHAGSIPLGIMVEVPSTAILSDLFAREADFFSVGTNDLVQYTLAVDRASYELAQLATPFDPSVLRLIQLVVKAGAAHGCPVGVCGAMSNDPLAAVLLVGLGLRELSMECSAIPEVKEALARIDVAEAEEVARAALSCSTAEEVEHLLAEAFAPRFADLLGD